MRIAFGSDGTDVTVERVLAELREHAEVDVMTSESWPDFAHEVAEAVAGKAADFGVVMCWTGTGVAIAANKVSGVRAATAWEPWIAEHARKWNDANVLALSMKRTAPDVAVECVRAFLAAEVDPDEREAIEKLE